MKKKVADLKGIQITFRTVGAWEVIITSTAERRARSGGKDVTAILQNITTPIYLQWRRYLIDNRKYLVSGDIYITI